jgi:hypothetical protein
MPAQIRTVQSSGPVVWYVVSRSQDRGRLEILSAVELQRSPGYLPSSCSRGLQTLP